MGGRGWLARLGILGVVAFVCSGVVDAGTLTPSGTLTIAVPDEPPGLDPTTSPAAAIARIVYNNLLEGLVKLNMQGEIVPALAERHEVSADGTVFTFALRHGVKFHNGRPFSAADVKFTLERNLDPKTGHPHRAYYEDISDILVLDAHAVRITLQKPNAMFLFNLARANSAMIARNGKSLSRTLPRSSDV